MNPPSLMVRLVAGAPNDALLRLTVDLAARLKATRVIGISACQPLQLYTSPDAYVPPDLINWDLDQMEKELKAAEKSFRAALEGKAQSLEWRSTIITFGTIADYVADQMRAADILITRGAEGASLFGSDRHVNLADLILKAGRPVLVVGAGVDKVDLRNVVIGWKDTREARRAAEDALPLLELADRVTVVEVASQEDLDSAHTRTEDVAAWLERRGISASACAVRAVDDDPTEIADLTKELGAGLLVGGAYGHTRVREWVLGGVTRDLLLRPTGCSLVSH